MTKQDAQTIERCYKNLNDLMGEAESVQQLLDEIKDTLEEQDADFVSLYNAGNNLDSVISCLQNANEELLDISKSVGV